MSFDIPAGKTIALVGTSGAGKSTILSLLERFYAADEGSILIDGRDISHIDARWLRSRTAVVPQTPTLFGGLSVDDNVRYGNPAASNEDVSAALKAADCAFVDSLPKGRHTLVGERGVSLSGGQRQRLAIARALLREPSILCLDEYTSALDAHTEESLATSISQLAHSKTCIIIAHRLATVKSADIILVLRDGGVIEQGSHAQLIKQGGHYADMVKKQLL
jgi:ABC-type multidrug transport system fused ATPase/permease subunit